MSIKRLTATLCVVLPSCALLIAGGGRHAAAADSPAALTAIADTADRICGIVATQGEADSAKAQADIHAELNGLARRLATVGGSAGADISSSKYQGLLQQDLPTTLKDIRDCKLKVFQQLQATLLPGTPQAPSGPGAPSAALLQAPSNAQPIDDVKAAGEWELGLYSCENGTNSITCYVTVTRPIPGNGDYRVDAAFSKAQLIDNFHVEHRLRRAFFVDGLGGHHETTNLSKGESIWLTLEFEAVHPVSSARILFRNWGGSLQLSGPVN